MANSKRRIGTTAFLVIAVVASALTTLTNGRPAAAASGFHAAYFSQSSSLARSPGEVGQFAVGYVNSGDRAWAKGLAAQQANLATAAPLDNTTDFAAGWAVGWLSPNRYAAQDPVLVAPGQIGFFIYTVIVPAGTPPGAHAFYGRPVIDGVTFLEDYGYFHTLTVTAVAPVQPAGPVLSTASAAAPTGGTTTRVDARWSAPVRCSGSYAVDGVAATVLATPGSSCQLTTRALAAGSTHTLTATAERDQAAGTLQEPNAAAVAFTVTALPVLPVPCDHRDDDHQHGPDQGAVAGTGRHDQEHGQRQPECGDRGGDRD